jgi:hypothetical protein
MFLNQPDFAGMLIALGLLIILRGAMRSWLNLRDNLQIRLPTT